MQVRNVLGYRYQRVQWYVRNCLEEPIAVGLKVSESMKSNRCYALLLWLRHFFWLLSLSKKWSSTPEYGISRWAIAIPPCIFQCKSCCISQSNWVILSSKLVFLYVSIVLLELSCNTLCLKGYPGIKWSDGESLTAANVKGYGKGGKLSTGLFHVSMSGGVQTRWHSQVMPRQHWAMPGCQAPCRKRELDRTIWVDESRHPHDNFYLNW